MEQLRSNFKGLPLRNIGVAAVLALVLMVVMSVVAGKPASAAMKTVFSSPNNVRIYACKSSSTGFRFGMQSLSSSAIHRVSFVDAGGRGNYLDYIPGHYGSKTSPYAQAKRDGTRYVKIKWTSSSKERSLGSFNLKHANLPNC